MYTLYIDTHDKDITFVLFKDDNILKEKKKESTKHSLYAIPLLQELLAETHITIDQISLIIVINGPGSFTGVRIGCVIAKIISYTKNIPLKTLSYLQALSLSFTEEVYLGISDKNGTFVGKFDKEHHLIDEYFYLSRQAQQSCSYPIIQPSNLDLKKVYTYMSAQPNINPHLLKPLYVKKLEVEND